MSEFNTEQSVDILNMSKRFTSWIENFEACVEFEGVAEEKKKPAVMALGGEKFRELCKTLDITAADNYAAMKVKLTTHYTANKNTSTERFKFLNMKPEFPEETHDKWVFRMRQKVEDCEFDKMDNKEAMKLVIMLHTHNTALL